MESTRVYVGQLTSDIRENDLENFFKGYGRIREITLKNGYGFVEFDERRDADDAVHDLNGKPLMGEKIRVEMAHRFSRDRFSSSRGGGFRGRHNDRGYDRSGFRHGGSGHGRWERRRPVNPPRRSRYRLLVENLSSAISWRELKDFMNQAGEVCFTDVYPQRREGIVEFESSSAMENALKKLNGEELNGRRIRITEEKCDSNKTNRNRRSKSGGSSRSSSSRGSSKSKQSADSETAEAKRKQHNNSSASDLHKKNSTEFVITEFNSIMGQQQSAHGHGFNRDKKDDKDKKRRYEPPIPTRVGKKKRRARGPDAAVKLPHITPHARCRLKLLKAERIKDYLLLEEEFLKNIQVAKPQEERQEEERGKVDDLRGSPMAVGTLEEVIDDTHAIVSTSVGSEHYVTILSFVDKDQLEPGCTVLLNHKTHSVIGVLTDDTDPMVSVMKLEKAPKETYADVGGLDAQIQEIKESVELPLTHPELYEEMGIRPPKGVILYGAPGTGKTLLAKAVANQTSATFLRVVGSELIQKYLGDGPKLVRELFRVAEEHAPSIVFIDEIDAIGTKRYESNSGGEREIQRTMLELLNQLDGFDSRGDVKVIMATNRIETLDPALIRPGRIDRKIEFPLPDEVTIRKIFQIHTSRMTIADNVDFEEFIMAKDDLSGADIKAICTEAGLQALRDRRMKVTHEDFKKARESVLYRKKEGAPSGLYI
ncbi:26S protease regulatory subunit 4 [Trichinella pseudospiralis]|uniref:26S protease regulatory subunit 4 n=3 Tax=Trichinella pseudospiralis TaxID=6337 RepID=A0A0V1E598_TRIPS|nr:26S protease regulatory subunit 4 [Trichinella pseudospiralis]